MNAYIGLAILVVTIFLLVKRYETRLVLLCAGFIMAAVAGKPMAVFAAFVDRMVYAGLVPPILSAMGFAYVMKITECDKHLVWMVSKPMMKVRMFLVPGAIIVTALCNLAIQSAAGTSAAVGAILIPVLMNAGIKPAAAASAVMAGTFGSSLNPGNPHDIMVAKIANANVMDAVNTVLPATLAGIVIAAVSLTIIVHGLKEDGRGNGEASRTAATAVEIPQINYFMALIPFVPLVILLLGSMKIVPAFNIPPAYAMMIGVVAGAFASFTRQKPSKEYVTNITKGFFDGMGKAYGDVIGIIIAAAVFAKGLQEIGLIKVLTETMVGAESVVKAASAFGPFLLAILVGSGDAATIAFNEAVTPHAEIFGMSALKMGSLAHAGGFFGRTMSPLAPAAIICAGMAGTDPLNIMKRNAPAMVIATLAAVFILA